MQEIVNYICEGITEPSIIALVKILVFIFMFESGSYIVALISKVGQVCGR